MQSLDFADILLDCCLKCNIITISDRPTSFQLNGKKINNLQRPTRLRAMQSRRRHHKHLLPNQIGSVWSFSGNEFGEQADSVEASLKHLVEVGAASAGLLLQHLCEAVLWRRLQAPQPDLADSEQIWPAAWTIDDQGRLQRVHAAWKRRQC